MVEAHGRLRRVLVADDDEAMLRSYKRAAGAHFSVVTATSRAAARSTAREHQPELAIVDLQLGDDSGIDLIRDLKAEHPASTVVLISAYGSIDTAVWAMRAGADDVLQKPVTFSEIVRRVDGEASEPSSIEPITLERVQWEHVQRVLRDCKGNVSLAAKKLGVYRSTLRRWLVRSAPRS